MLASLQFAPGRQPLPWCTDTHPVMLLVSSKAVALLLCVSCASYGTSSELHIIYSYMKFFEKVPNLPADRNHHMRHMCPHVSSLPIQVGMTQFCFVVETVELQPYASLLPVKTINIMV